MEYTRGFLMLCPKCQHQERFTVNVSWLDEEDKRVSPCLAMICPKCRTEMYDADDALVNILAELNKAGYATKYHCAIIHQDGFINKVNPKHTLSDYAREHLINADEKTIYRGPYIIISGLSMYEIVNLTDIVINQGDDTYCVFDVDTFEDNIILTVCCTDFEDPLEVRRAATKLSDSIRAWLMLMQEHGHAKADNPLSVINIANYSWSSHRSIDYDEDE